MKDIDFDELDRAVNSVISDTSAKTDVAASQNEEVTNVPLTVTQQDQTPSSSPLPLVARRSGGRFMDVVHPSSDMRAPAAAESSLQPSRGSVTITPPAGLEEAMESSHEDETEGGTDQTWPDPIDFQQPETPTESAEVSETTPSDAPVLESPFLSDAKVEKRPLGAFSADQNPADLHEQDGPDSLDTQDDSDRSEHPMSTDVPMPAELQNEVLDIESNEDVPTVSEPVATPEIETPEPIGPTSITQQYKEQPSTTNQQSAAIFDTDAYKKPIAHPHKKKSGWLMVLWIFLLLVIGAGAGAAVYFYVLPLL